ncbi:MAG: HAD hydrolase-like protein [Verrucomicrobiales bacterium]
MKYKLAIFDFDGTLADSVQWCLAATNELSSLFGFKRIEPHEQDVVRGYNTHQLLKHLGLPMWKMPLVAVQMRKLAARDIGRITLFGGVPEMLRDLNATGISVALVTSNGEENVKAVLGPENLQHIQELSCGASLLGKTPKLKAVLKKFRLSAAEAIYIGDETRDAIAARGAGLDFGAVTWGYASRESLFQEKPDQVFTSVKEIASILAQQKSPTVSF